MSNCLEIARNGRLCAGAEEYERRLSAMQAKLDLLMLEYCPDEMTEEQLKSWGEHQVSAGE
jgi:hypothetical protein